MSSRKLPQLLSKHPSRSLGPRSLHAKTVGSFGLANFSLCCRSRNKHFCNQHRYAHCHKIHGGAGLPGRVSGAKIPVQRVTKKQNVAWKCPCCACGILQTDAVGQTVGALVRVKRLHRETQHPEISPQQWNRLHRARAAQKVTHRVKQRAGNLNASVARAGVVERSVWTPFQMPSLANKNSTITLPRAFQCKACRAIKYSIPATNAHECTRTVPSHP